MQSTWKTIWLILILLVGSNKFVWGVVQEKKEGYIRTQIEPESKRGKLKEIKRIWKELKKRTPKKKKSDDTLLIIFLVLLGIVMYLALIAAIVFVISCFFKALFDGYCLH